MKYLFITLNNKPYQGRIQDLCIMRVRTSILSPYNRNYAPDFFLLFDLGNFSHISNKSSSGKSRERLVYRKINQFKSAGLTFC